MKKTRTIVLNSVKEAQPPLGVNLFLWVEVGSSLLDCGWVKAERISNLAAPPLIDFTQPGVNQDLVWLFEGVPQEMREDHLWSIPSVKELGDEQAAALVTI